MLKYLFKSEFSDGTTFTQTQEDVSKIDPTRSAFYDILESKSKIKKFTLSKFFEHYSVNLETGEFEINGVTFEVETGKPPPIIDGHPPELKLIYYRQHKQKMNVTVDTESGIVTNATPGSDDITYFIGWETTINGKNYKKIIGIK